MYLGGRGTAQMSSPLLSSVFVRTDSSRAYCNVPGECVCREGYGGTLCQNDVRMVLCACSFHIMLPQLFKTVAGVPFEGLEQ